MQRCSNPDHPHCTLQVAPDAAACAHGHAQPTHTTTTAAEPLGQSFGLLQAARARRAGDASPTQAALRPHLHVSGFDPRAAGGRQAIRLALRGMPDDAPAEITLLLESALLPGGRLRQRFTRALGGAWRPLVIEFSSRGREHGQYRIDVELRTDTADGAVRPRTWVATLLLLVPRADATLGEIHQTFLATHKNVRISADDASIARVHGLAGGGSLDLDIQAKNAGIAQIQLHPDGGAGRADLALPTIAWDEDLIEIGTPAAHPGTQAARADGHPCPASGACLVYAEPDAGFPRHVRLFALDECVLGRYETTAPEADLLLMHHDADGAQRAGLTRRLSARHAVIRPAHGGFEIEDVSRYGLLLDGVWPGKHAPVPLRLGMRIEFTASIQGVMACVVTALLPHAVVLHRVDAGGAAECFVLCAPAQRPGAAVVQAARAGMHGLALPRAAALPLVFHRDGGFWHLDPVSGVETALTPATALDRLSGFAGPAHSRVRFACGPRPEDWIARGAATGAAPGTRAPRRSAAPPATTTR